MFLKSGKKYNNKVHSIYVYGDDEYGQTMD